ncbi:unnamed protein product [Rhodiola kirilowii]
MVKSRVEFRTACRKEESDSKRTASRRDISSTLMSEGNVARIDNVKVRSSRNVYTRCDNDVSNAF